MKLSVVIVNYNVKYFLEQCLYSVRKASTNIETEIFVVDNNSVDGSVKMVREKFPEAILIDNKENLGFAKANNQAMRIAKGEYILLLNPDTIVEDDTFTKVVSFMDETPDAGGLGVKMIDGTGRFLPESKRGLPTPNVAFYKIFGLSAIFPKSKIFGKYHLGYLDKEEINEIDILAGAFMLMRKTALDKVGLLDEEFFMYGEDIDLSYRLTLGGYKNYYYPKTRIIHYKGESTKKSSVNYVLVFYNAMVIFAKKHFSKKNAKLFSVLINFAVYLRAFVAIANRFTKRALLPLIDIVLFFTGIYFIKGYWEQNIIFPDGGQYPPEFMNIVVPVYILIWLFSIFFSGGYDRPLKLHKIISGISIGTIIILVAYALLDESWRFSRAIIILGALWGIASITGIRLLLHTFKLVKIGTEKNRRFVIVGNKNEAERVSELLNRTYLNPGFIGFIKPDNAPEKNNGFIGNISQVKDIITIYKIDEVIFCSKDIAHREIIDKMSELHIAHVDYKIAPEDSLSIIGSNSINTAGDLYIVNINAIDKASNLRNKRLLDLLVSFLLVFLLPISIFIVRKPLGYFINIAKVFFGKRSWVGYYKDENCKTDKLPSIKTGVLNPTDSFKHKIVMEDTPKRLNLLYARDYKTLNDLNIIFRGFKNLGRK